MQNQPKAQDLRRITRKTRLQIIGVGILLLLWLTIGRAFFGSFGWFTVILVLWGPLITVVLLIILTVSIKPIPKSATASVLTRRDKTLLYLLGGSIFLSGCFIVDGGDTPDSTNSIITHFFGDDFVSLSSAGFALLFIASAILYIVTVIQLSASNKQVKS